jgi:hypothetical protein
MTHYIQIAENQSIGVWLVEDSGARRIDATNVYFPPRPGEEMLSVLKSCFPATKFLPLKLRPGQYHPRMARPNNSHPHQSPGTNPANHEQRNLIETYRGQLTALRSQLETIFRVVHPAEPNFNAYGHDIRNLLILAATEVEAHCKGILTANGIRARDTHDYAKLSGAMRLGEYAIRLPFYPWLKPLKPFVDWKPSKTPTKDLPWYDAYNDVKHDRETLFERATLLYAVQAVAACAVMTFAQFGKHGFHYREEISSFFDLVEAPAWEPSEVYCAPYGESGYVAVPYQF